MAATTAVAAVCSTTLLMAPPRESSPQFSRFPAAPRKSLFSGILLVPAPISRAMTTTLAVERSDSGNCDRSHTEQTPILERFSSFSKPLLSFTASNFLPIALITAVASGMVNPALGCHAHKYSLSKFATFGIFFIAGLKLKGEEIAAVAEAWPVGLFGLASILLISPFLSTLIMQVQLAPQEFVTGLALFCCMPTTLSSGVALTQLVGGNSALALTMTVVSNLLGIITVPFWISKLLAAGFGVSIPVKQLFWNLTLMLLVPLLFGKVLQLPYFRLWDFHMIFGSQVARNNIKGLGTYVDQNRKIFTTTSIILLSLTPWMQVSKARHLLLAVKLEVFIKAIALGILLHLALLAFNLVAIGALSAGSGGTKSVFSEKKNARTLLLICSQKALLIVVTVIEQLNGALGQSGLLVLPCIAAHINQVVIDSILVNFWIQKDESLNKTKQV